MKTPRAPLTWRTLCVLLSLLLLPFPAGSQSQPGWTAGTKVTPNMWNALFGSKQDVVVGWVLSTIFGLKADGSTPDDTALSNMVAACAYLGGRMQLPAGRIVYTGTINLSNCFITGTGVPGSSPSTASQGTTILLKSTTAKPFVIGQNWGFEGVNFYWPDQTGAGAQFTATGSGTNLTVTSVSAVNGGSIRPGYLLCGPGVPLNTTIVSQTSGTTGGAGVYVTSHATTSSAAALNAVRAPTVYPPLFSDDGSNGPGRFKLENITAINAYDFLVGTPTVTWGGFFISNLTIYALHEGIAPGTIGDSFHMGPAHFTPGPWLALTSFAPGTLAALNWAGQNNTMFHGQGSTFQMAGAQITAEAWRYGIRLDAGTVMSQSIFQIGGDSLATVIDASLGTYAGYNQFVTGSAGCNVADWLGHQFYGAPSCFVMSATSTLLLNNFTGGARGDFITSNGASLQLIGLGVNAGGNADGAEYSIVNLTANAGSVMVQDSVFSGVACTTSALGCAHVHGINTGAFNATFMQVQNNRFSYFQDVLTITVSPALGNTLITGNNSFTTNGSAAVTLSGSGPITWGADNVFDKPLVPAIQSGFGSSPSLTAGQDFRAFSVNVGGGGAVSSGIVTLPIPASHGYNCDAVDVSHPASFTTVPTPNNATQITLTNYSRTTGLVANWTAGDQVNVKCAPY